MHATNVDSIFQLRSIPMKNARYICILIKNFWHARLHNARMLVCEHFSKRERGYVRRPTVSRGHQPRVTPNIFIDYLWKIDPPPIFSHDHCPPVASQNSSSVLSQLKCQLCSNLLTQPLELPCSALVCTKCIVEWVAATGAENCPCYSDDGPLLSSRIRPAKPDILLLADICAWGL